MRHGVKTKKLGRTASHRHALMRNLVRALFQHERIQTTLPKAKEARRLAERLVTYSLKGTVAARREAARYVPEKDLVKKLFDTIGPRFAGRNGGYTRIYRLGPREGDGAEMAVLELTVREATRKEKRAKEAAEKTRGRRKPARRSAKKDEDKKAKK